MIDFKIIQVCSQPGYRVRELCHPDGPFQLKSTDECVEI